MRVIRAQSAFRDKMRAQIWRKAAASEDELGAFQALVQHGSGRFCQISLRQQLMIMRYGFVQHRIRRKYPTERLDSNELICAPRVAQIQVLERGKG